MGLVMVKRRQRRPAPELPDGDLQVEAPPELPQPGGKNWQQLMMVLPMVAGSGAMMLMMASSGSGGPGGVPLRAVTGGLFAVSMLGMVFMNMMNSSKGPSKQEMLQIRRDYLRRLSQLRRQVHKTRREQRRGLFYRHPDPDTLWSTAASSRLWERRSGDGDFAVIRMGLGPQQLATPIRVPPSKPVEDLEPLCTAALRRFLNVNAVVNDLPVAMDLRGFSRLYYRGDSEKSRALLRAMIAQIATWHSPDELVLAVCASPTNMQHWDWMKWLPHALHPEKTDALGQVRLMGNSLREIEERFGDLLVGRPRFNPASPPWDGHHVIVILDGGNTDGADHLATEGGVEGVTIMDMSTPPPRQMEPGMLLVQHRDDQTLRMGTVDAIDDIRRPDSLTIEEAESLARRLTPLRMSMATSSGDGDDDNFEGNLSFTDLLDIGDPYDYDPDRAWAPRPNRDRLRVPLGVGPDGLPVDLDIKESAQDGMGPHGLMIGATGSGKSEALRTLVLALAAVHSPEVLNFVLVDFKGGATFTRLDKLPHTSAVITNLSDELVLVDRMKDAIEGETLRRQELLRSAGKFASLREYEKARAAGAPIAPMPSLLIICDEFSELLAAKPDFIDMFVQIGRVGRSLGVHLLLASQRLEEGKLRGLDTHLSYRIGLRTFSAIESRTVLGVSDAYELPRAPGHGYLRFGTEPLIRFRASYVSGVYQRSAAEKAIAESGGPQIREFTASFVAPPPKPKKEKKKEEVADDDEKVGDSLMDILVSKMEGKGMPAHKVWLDPLDVPPTLEEFLPLGTSPERGLGTTREDQQGTLRVPIALVDKPFEQRRDVYWLNLAAGAGHVAIAGGTQSGKSTALRSLIASLALTHTPKEVQVYCLDFGGGGLALMRDLPHVGGVYQRLDADECRRTVSEVFTVMEQREQRFARLGVDSMQTYRKMRADGRVTDDPFGDVFLCIDGWQTVREDFEALEGVITQIAQRGLGYGVHVVATTAKWSTFRPAIRDVFGSKIELKLADAFDSFVGRKVAEQVPANRPGRGMDPGGLHMLAALPRIDGNPDANDLPGGITDFVSKVKDAWRGAPAPAVRLLPAKLPYESLPISTFEPQDKWKIPVGIAENNLQPVYLDLANDPHFIFVSDVETGKSTFLRQLLKTITTRATSKEAQFVLFDYRRSLLGAVPQNYLVKHCSTAEQSAEMVQALLSAGKGRRAPDNVTPQQLRDRSWWTGPEMFAVIDDYDLVATGGYQSPLMPLLELIPQGRDIGLHVIVTRRAGGAARDLFGQFLGRMKDLATPGFQGSAPKSEGKLMNDIKASKMPNGRGWLVNRRDGARMVQMAYLPEEEL
ncbi:type VII secretion protein EccCa [Stackebrandtia soli]|uniref:type VII secretion protein EccCa n=1 Tax=Stackebrandtia soli TaxID=1892856 RepID=UPI0039E9114A